MTQGLHMSVDEHEITMDSLISLSIFHVMVNKNSDGHGNKNMIANETIIAWNPQYIYFYLSACLLAT